MHSNETHLSVESDIQISKIWFHTHYRYDLEQLGELPCVLVYSRRW